MLNLSEGFFQKSSQNIRDNESHKSTVFKLLLLSSKLSFKLLLSSRYYDNITARMSDKV